MSGRDCTCASALEAAEANIGEFPHIPITLSYFALCPCHGCLSIDFEIYATEPGVSADQMINRACSVYLNGRLVDWFDIQNDPKKMVTGMETPRDIVIK